MNGVTASWPVHEGVMYFRVADNEAELRNLRSTELAVIPSIWGHRAGNPRGILADLDFLTSRVRVWLDA
jgi:homoserine O-acetyltransferase/O-succinyltransferase